MWASVADLHDSGARTYGELRAGFKWRLPAEVDLAGLCVDRHPARRVGLIEVDEGGVRREFSFGALGSLSRRLANGLAGLGVGLGDRVGVVLPQCAEVGLVHLAAYRLGGIVLPLSGLFGPDALRYRLGDSGARVVVTDAAHLELVAEVARDVGARVVSVHGAVAPHVGFWDLVDGGSESFEAVVAGPDAPALLIYTSGTTGLAKGALHGRRVLFGHLPGFELSHDFFGRPDDVFWTPADWAWIGGLLDGLLPSWFFGRPVIATRRARFDPEWAVRLMASEGVRNVFLPPTALKLMRQADVDGGGARLRTVGCGGEPLGEEVLAWTRERFGVTINEFYGQTEANLLVGNCGAVWQVRPGSMGRPYPGHDVRVLAENGRPAGVGEVGEVALGLPDPVAFLGYWNQPEQTQAKHSPDGRWLMTGDLARADEDGYLWYLSRNDDVITSGGYRIGPAEIEACLMRHPAVALAAAVGVPDPVRGEAVKACLVLKEGIDPGPDLEQQIRDHVKHQLAAYLYPREIEFRDQLPMTTTGKIRRADLKTTTPQQRGDR